MNMVERVAKTMFALEGGNVAEWEGSLLQEHGREARRKMARVIIKAMREPTEEMAYAGLESCDEPRLTGMISAWRAMIDAALAEVPA